MMDRVELASEDLRIDVGRQIGGGACSIRITHLPTGTTVTVDDQPTTKDNRNRAMAMLRESLAGI